MQKQKKCDHLNNRRKKSTISSCACVNGGYVCLVGALKNRKLTTRLAISKIRAFYSNGTGTLYFVLISNVPQYSSLFLTPSHAHASITSTRIFSHLHRNQPAATYTLP